MFSSHNIAFRYLLLVTGIVSRNYKTRRLLLLLCMYRYTFRFQLKFTNTILRKLATFYIWNENIKLNGWIRTLHGNTLHVCSGDYVTTNHQTLIHAEVILHVYHVRLYQIHLGLRACKSVSIRNIRFLTFSFLTNSLHDVLDKSRYEHKIS